MARQPRATSVIYQIKNLVNRKLYIGSAINFNKRLAVHLSYLRAGKHHCIHLQHAWDKDGEINFEFSILEQVDDIKSLLDREQYWLDQTRSYNRDIGYNIHCNARSSLGSKRSPEVILAMRQRLIGRKHTEASKIKMRMNHKGTTGQKRTLNERLRMSASMKGVKRSDKAKTNMSLCRIGKPISDQAKLKLREAARIRSPWPHADGKVCKCDECKAIRKIRDRSYYEKAKDKRERSESF